MKRVLSALVVALLLWAQPASAAIARAGTPVDGGNNGGGSTSLTFAVTVPSSASLFVAFAGDAGGGADDCASVVFNTAESLTLLKKNVTITVNRNIYLYWIASPTATTANVVITCSSTHYILGGAAMYTGMQTTSQPDTTASVSNVVTSTVTTSFTTASANDWGVLVGGWYASNAPLTNGTGSDRVVFDNNFGTWAIFDTNTALSSGPNSMDITGGAPNPVATVMAAMIPSGGGPPATSPAPCMLRLLGVGCLLP